jgi:hypothetical protein
MSRDAAPVRRFRRSQQADWEWIGRPVDGVSVTAADVVRQRQEFGRCEPTWRLLSNHDVSDTTTSNHSRRPAGPDTPSKYDWDAFAGANERRLHDRGMVAMQCEIVREILEWLASGDCWPAQRAHGADERVGNLEGIGRRPRVGQRPRASEVETSSSC